VAQRFQRCDKASFFDGALAPEVPIAIVSAQSPAAMLCPAARNKRPNPLETPIEKAAPMFSNHVL
jgi:hypothetical protein